MLCGDVEHVVLVGLMASGKTSVGRLLAARSPFLHSEMVAMHVAGRADHDFAQPCHQLGDGPPSETPEGLVCGQQGILPAQHALLGRPQVTRAGDDADMTVAALNQVLGSQPRAQAIVDAQHRRARLWPHAQKDRWCADATQ